MSKTRKTTAHRPSQAHMQYVKNAQGEKVLNTAYVPRETYGRVTYQQYLQNDFQTEPQQDNAVQDVLQSAMSTPSENNVPSWEVDNYFVEEVVQEHINDCLYENPNATLEDALDSIDTDEIGTSYTEDNFFYYSDFATKLLNMSSSELEDTLNDTYHIAPAIAKACGTDSTSDALVMMSVDYQRNKFFDSKVTDDTTDNDMEALEEEFVQYVDSNSEITSPYEIVRMVYSQYETPESTNMDNNEFHQWVKDAEEFQIYVYNNYNKRDGYFGATGESLDVGDELNTIAKYACSEEVSHVAKQYIERIRETLSH